MCTQAVTDVVNHYLLVGVFLTVAQWHTCCVCELHYLNLDFTLISDLLSIVGGEGWMYIHVVKR